MNDARLTELEIRLAHQEKTIADLNGALCTQQQDLLRLHEEIAYLRDRLKAVQSSIIASEAEETPPPHY